MEDNYVKDAERYSTKSLDGLGVPKAEDWNRDDIIIEDIVGTVIPDVMEVFDLHTKMVGECKAHGTDLICQDRLTLAVITKLEETLANHNMTLTGFVEEANYRYQTGRFQRVTNCAPKPVLAEAREYVDRNQGNLIDDPDYWMNRTPYWPMKNNGTPPLMQASNFIKETPVEKPKKPSIKDAVRFFLGLA